MDEVDFSNPVVIITIFFGLMLTGFMFLIKLMPVLLFGGLFGSLFGVLAGGFAWFGIFVGKD